MEEGTTVERLILRAIEDKLTLEIEYKKNSFERSTRTISEISISDEFGLGYISAYCHTKNERRTFKISRILDARIVTNKNSLPYEFNPNKPIFNLSGEVFQ